MATYKEIRGTQIEAVATDPSNPVEGQVWYNTTSNVLKGQAATTAGTWATGGTMNTARNSLGGAGTQTAALGFGGQPPNTGATESYNGTSWTEVNDLSARNGVGSTGTQTSAIAFGGEGSAPNPKNLTELWNGSNWTEVNNLNSASKYRGGSGTDSTAALAFAGIGPDNASDFANTEIWNGTNWTEVNDMNEAKHNLTGSGTSTATVAFGGTPGTKDSTELWNGTNWTEVNNLNTGGFTRASSILTSTAAIAMGGQAPTGPSVLNATEIWNGTNWTSDTNMPATKAYGAGAGTSTAAITFGGANPSPTATTFEYTGAGPITRTFTDS